MIATVDTGQKTFLTGVDKINNGRHDCPGYRGSQEPVVSVGDTKRAGVRNEAGELFRKKEEEAMVEAFRGGYGPS